MVGLCIPTRKILPRDSVLAGVLLGVFLLGGCARFHAETLRPSQTLADFEARTLESPDLKQFIEFCTQRPMTAWPVKKWDLDSLTLAALFYHSDLEVARAQWQVARGAIVTAGERPNPTVGFNPEYKAGGTSGISPWLYGLTFDLPVETMGKRGRRIDQARHHARSAALNIASAAWQVRSRLHTAWIQLKTARANTALWKEQLELQEGCLQSLNGAENGDSLAPPDRLQLEITWRQTQISFLEARRQSEDAEVQLAESLGIPVHAVPRVALEPNSGRAQKFSKKEIRQRALTQRPDLLGLLADYEASQSALQLEIARQYPDVHLGPGYTWDQGQNKWSAGVSITLPVFNHNQGPVAEAKARREEARLRFTALQEKIIFEVERVFSAYEFCEQKWEMAQSLLEVQRQQEEIHKQFLMEGEASRLAALNFKLALKTAEFAAADAGSKRDLALAALEDAMMAPLDSQLFPLSGEKRAKVLK